ncbi:glycoside hydrolase family 18 protein [Aspergillus fischeri NRRL 181]|uniref:Glycosyl hydrolase, family 18, putative n=1 Tax=Neosartorya fischeri (strain ATCC 1020 / DSM 3700 / CBS 544.65 / FGSC A1164 / JCM 1740 / NRRL 181 / WB 181) TaxID=331117 RepID=A1DA23_NEOFI|nr:glycosyl hydrolase, family 18, putative [Aspergillus fischeri NRRL 181]EAW20654.1 glycosyl hydrolase, family 18, putative [Aspergillus fischeri NRRL 181]
MRLFQSFCLNITSLHFNCASLFLRVVGYYEFWSSRRGCNTVWPEQIKLGVYSHINFAFATIHPKTYEVLPANEWDVPLYKHPADLKQYDPNLKVMIVLGGWTFNDPGPAATLFFDLAASEEKQKKFVKSVSFMSTCDFDGVNLDWEYPEASDWSGRPADYDNFPRFTVNLKSSLDKTPGRSKLSITLPALY